MGLCCADFRDPSPPLPFPSRLFVTHSIWTPPDLNADECRLCFLGAALVSEKMSQCEPLARVRHAEMCTRALRQAPPHTGAHTNIQCVPFRPVAASQRVTGTATFLLVQQKSLSRRSRLCYSSSSSSTAEEEIAVEGLGPSLATACPDY